jgi:aspartyl/asparaginyl beta-hydroxylase (cupin superfamily)
MKKRYIAACVAFVVLVVIMLAVILTPYRSFLGLLNAQIAKKTNFRPYYAGRGDLPCPRDLVPEIGDLEDNFEVVQAEALGVFENHLTTGKIPRMDESYNLIFAPMGGDSNWASRALGAVSDKATRLLYGDDVDTFTKIGSKKWRTFNLVLFDRDVPGNVDKCPELTRLVKKIPGMQSAMISILAPGAYIPPHSDPAKGVIRYHLAFKVPEDRENCFIEVMDNGTPLRYCWEEGKGVMFDDAYVHWVQNHTDGWRVILFMDILRPLKGSARVLQKMANIANHYHPGVRKLIRASVV